MQFGPMLIVFIVAGKRRMNDDMFRWGGFALIASGVCTYVGVRYFGLYAIADRYHPRFITGLGASVGGLVVAGMGVIAVASSLVWSAFKKRRHRRRAHPHHGDRSNLANQPPLRMPTSGTPAAKAPVAPPSGAAGR